MKHGFTLLIFISAALVATSYVGCKKNNRHAVSTLAEIKLAINENIAVSMAATTHIQKLPHSSKAISNICLLVAHELKTLNADPDWGSVLVDWDGSAFIITINRRFPLSLIPGTEYLYRFTIDHTASTVNDKLIGA